MSRRTNRRKNTASWRRREGSVVATTRIQRLEAAWWRTPRNFAQSSAANAGWYTVPRVGSRCRSVHLQRIGLEMAVFHDPSVERQILHRRIDGLPSRADATDTCTSEFQATGLVDVHDLGRLDAVDRLVEVHPLIDFLGSSAAQPAEVVHIDQLIDIGRVRIAALNDKRDLVSCGVDWDRAITDSQDVLREQDLPLLQDRLTRNGIALDVNEVAEDVACLAAAAAAAAAAPLRRRSHWNEKRPRKQDRGRARELIQVAHKCCLQSRDWICNQYAGGQNLLRARRRDANRSIRRNTGSFVAACCARRRQRGPERGIVVSRVDGPPEDHRVSVRLESSNSRRDLARNRCGIPAGP